MAYQANRSNSDLDMEEERNNQNNANNIRNAADVAMASKAPPAVVAGAAVKGADKLTGGRASEALGRAMTTANKHSPLGKPIQNLSNSLSESGASDKIGKVAAIKGRANAGGNTPNQVVNNNTRGGGNSDSLPSSLSNNNRGGGTTSSNKTSTNNNNSNSDSTTDDNDNKHNSYGIGSFKIGTVGKIILLSVLPSVLLLSILVISALIVVSVFADFDDAFGVSSATGGDTGNIAYNSRSEEQGKFYERINNIELEFLAQGKLVDSLKVVAVFHVLNENGADLAYENISESEIRDVANSLFNGSMYDEETFKSNLINNIFPKYLPDSSEEDRKYLADSVLTYVSNYNNLIKKEEDSLYCSSSANCNYSIKGYYIEGKGNVSERVDVSNLYVRLMQCGTANGHNYGGVFGQPLAGEELVPFEKYVLGVAYQEIGPDAPKEAIKAQMIAARSFILARHADMGSWRTLKKEDDKWVLQAAACTQDQVYCDPDQGCSGTNGQWGEVHSGLGHGSGFSRNPMPQDSPLRTYASETSGEVLVNGQGYIIYTGYLANEQNQFVSLANSGFNYKQILLQVYNQGNRNYGASDVKKNSCSGNSVGCRISTGDYASWKQSGASWSNIKMGNSGSTISSIGCLVTSVSMLIAKSGVNTVISNFNPGTFVEYLNQNGGFDELGNLQYYPISKVAPSFKYVNQISVIGMSRQQKLNKLKELISQGYYVVAEVKGNTGQHWVAIDSVNGDTINMLDPGSQSTDMWREYNWVNTSYYTYFKVN